MKFESELEINVQNFRLVCFNWRFLFCFFLYLRFKVVSSIIKGLVVNT